MVKDKAVCERTYDEYGFRRRAACVCVRGGGGGGGGGTEGGGVVGGASSSSPAAAASNKPEVLLVTGSRHPERWVVPGGGVEPAEEADAAAVREVREEAGVVGTLGRCLGTFENCDKRTRTVVYVMVVSELLEQWEDNTEMGRRRKWFTIDEAKAQLAEHKAVQMSYLDAYTDSCKS